MENHDSRTAHSHEASTDERASFPHPQGGAAAAHAAPPDEASMPEPTAEEPSDPVCFPEPEPHAPDEDGPFQSFATDAEAEAYHKGLTAGIRAAGREPGHPHMPADFSLDLMRDPDAPPLTSTKLVEAFPLIPGEGAEKACPAERQDGWTGARMKRFLDVLADTGVVTDACRATGMSRRSAYTLRNSARGRAFRLGWDAALLLSQPSVADDVASRSRYGVVGRVYRNGELVAERHRYDNRLTMSVLTRLDKQIAEMRRDQAAAARIAADEWEQYTALVAAGEGTEAFLAARSPKVPAAPAPARAPAAAAADPQPCGCGNAASEAALLARLASFERFGAGLPSEIATADLDPAEMERWTADQIDRAQASGFLARLPLDAWPQALREGEGDGTDGRCELRYLHGQYAAQTAVRSSDDEGENSADFDPDAEREDDFGGCIVWQKSEDLSWWTDFPPPPGFDGRHEGTLGTGSYIRTLTDGERRMMKGGDLGDEETLDWRSEEEPEPLPGSLGALGGADDDDDEEEPDHGGGARTRAARTRELQAARRRFFDIEEDEEEDAPGAGDAGDPGDPAGEGAPDG
jgi:hypothetical protein